MATDARVKTQPVRAKILTDEYEIEGNVHLKPGNHQGRVSDILNAPEVEFIPVTQATCTSRSSDSRPVQTDCTIVQVKTIRMVFPFEDS
ncbi:MAG: DUF6812 domain-containing protein [Thermoleophilia bacterium]|jgi:hypothetical protein|nr:hypothetical protein [Actinomycetota bacterium]MCL6092591.1 hypothetical protein [Actinomycetota bacterium]MDA8166883.1 hypothetical protein [Actinomycetota bacterium]